MNDLIHLQGYTEFSPLMPPTIPLSFNLIEFHLQAVSFVRKSRPAKLTAPKSPSWLKDITRAMEIHIHPYNPLWPFHYETIASQLEKDMRTANINFISIVHIGSTSIPDLVAKPIIDILITISAADFADSRTLPLMIAALRDGDQQGGYYYIGDGGLRDRWSFKLGIREDQYGVPAKPLRNVYVVPDGGILHRCAVLFRDCLRREENSDLKKEYGQLKRALAEWKDFVNIWDYTDQKNDVIQKILKRAGCTDNEIKEREELRIVNWPEELII